MPGIICVEGADCTGKTTLIERALGSWAVGGVVLHSTREKDVEAQGEALLAVWWAALRALLAGKWVFLDRWWPSNSVYQPVYGGDVIPLELQQFLHFSLTGLQLGGYVFCADFDSSDTVKRHGQVSQIREEMYSDISEVAKHYSRFCVGARSIGQISSFLQCVRTIDVFSCVNQKEADLQFEKKCRHLQYPWPMKSLEMIGRSLAV